MLQQFDKTDILNFLTSHKDKLEKEFFITKIGLFGSYAKGTANEDSDIDIVIQSTKKDFFLREDLREYLESNLKKSVDIGYLDSIRTYYKNKIVKDIIYI